MLTDTSFEGEVIRNYLLHSKSLKGGVFRARYSHLLNRDRRQVMIFNLDNI